MSRLSIGLFLFLSLGWAVGAQEAPPVTVPPPGSSTPNWDARAFIMKNHLHQFAGATTIALAAFTGTAGATMAAGIQPEWLPRVHGALAYGTIAAGAATLALGLTAYSDQLDTVWPHALFMGLAETGFVVNAFVLQPGSLPHRITGALSITSLGLGLLSILLIKG